MLMGKGLKRNISFQVFRDVLGGNGGNAVCEMWVAESPEGDIACSKIFCADNKMTYMWSEATSLQHRGRGANCLLEYEVMQELARRGHKLVDVKRANVAEFSSFTSQFNPALVPYYMVER